MSNPLENKPVVVDIQDGIQRIRLNRPDKKNALTMAMYTTLAEALRSADDDKAVRVTLITGSEGCFTSGNDLGDFLNNPPRDETSPVFQFLQAISQAKKPVIAAVSGAAVGIGTTLLLHCDLVYADTSAMLQMPFTNLGLSPEAASSLLLPQLMGHQRAAELLLLGEKFTAAKAYGLGLVNELCEPDELQDLAWNKAIQLAKQPAASVELAKALMKQGQAAQVQATISEEAQHFIQRLDSPEAKEAMQAFFERRAPDFSKWH